MKTLTKVVPRVVLNSLAESIVCINPFVYLSWFSALVYHRLGPVTIETWLILPVVICLSQRLSHACLSISNLYCETANGSLNQL